ncbi:tetratricopeptide repeat protein [Streptomyces sp. NPDC090022]|uniref:tetratricopeptide repeat protein n=1 Tax=Streptomyces sp. NPDC090022 TaxID=3365920 RepID=UPI0037FD775E
MTLHPAVEQADALLELKRYDQARALLARRLAEDPEDVRAWVKLGRCELGTDNPEQALVALDEAVRIAPEDTGALHMRAHALRHATHLDFTERHRQAEDCLREVLRLEPEAGYAHALLGELLTFTPGRGEEAMAHAREAVRLDPESVAAYTALWTASCAVSDQETFYWALEQVARLDPTDGRAVALLSGREAARPGTTAARAAEVYADALAVIPDSPGMRRGLDAATYRLLRGVRWLALACLAAAGVMIDAFPEAGRAVRELPVPLGNRLWVLVVMGAIWGFGAWRRYRGLRAGVRLNVWSLVGRSGWARIVVGQAAWATLCALLISQVPWTERLVPQVLFWAGLLPTLATLWFDRAKHA